MMPSRSQYSIRRARASHFPKGTHAMQKSTANVEALNSGQIRATWNALEMDHRQTAIETLNSVLADVIAVSFGCRQAHWNIRGENFDALHTMFGETLQGARRLGGRPCRTYSSTRRYCARGGSKRCGGYVAGAVSGPGHRARRTPVSRLGAAWNVYPASSDEQFAAARKSMIPSRCIT